MKFDMRERERRCFELKDTSKRFEYSDSSISSDLYRGQKNFNGQFAKNKAVQGRNSIFLASSSLG